MGTQRNFRRIDPAQATVVLIDGGKESSPRSGTGSPRRPRAVAAHRRPIRTGTIVTSVDAFGVDLRTADGST